MSTLLDLLKLLRARKGQAIREKGRCLDVRVRVGPFCWGRKREWQDGDQSKKVGREMHFEDGVTMPNVERGYSMDGNVDR